MLTKEENIMIAARNLEVTHRVDGNVEATKVLTETIDDNIKATKDVTDGVQRLSLPNGTIIGCQS